MIRAAAGLLVAAACALAAAPSEPPAGLACVGRDYSIDVQFQPVPGAASYQVDAGPISISAEANATLAGLDNDVAYAVRVRAANADGVGPAANCTATPFAPHVLLGEADPAELWGDDDAVVDFGSASSTAVALGDWDGDGDSDVIVYEANELLLYVRNDSRLVLDESFSYPTLSSTTRLVPTMADLDGDGDMDLVVGYSTGDLFFLRRDGPDTLVDDTAAVFGSYGNYDTDSAPALADIDADGDLDLFVGGYNGGTSFLENDGSNAFAGTPLPTLDGLDVSYWSKPTLCDVDGDSDLDAVLGRNTAKLVLLENLGTPWAPVWSSAAAVDLEYDGDEVRMAPSCMPGVGIAVGTYNGEVLWWPLVAHPTAPAAISATVGYGSATLEWTLPASTGGSTADLQYVVVANTSLDVEYNTTADLFMSFPGLTPHEPVVFAVRAVNEIGTSRYSDWTSTAVYPFPQPSAPRDLVCYGRDYSIELQWSPSENNDPTHYVITPDGSTTSGTNATVAGLDNDATYTIQVYGVNADGAGEAVNCTATPFAPHFLVGEADAAELWGDDDAVVDFGSTSETAVALGDWDGDGDSDMIVYEAAALHLYVRNDSRLVLDESFSYPTLSSTNRLVPTMTDLDGDGDVDLVVGETTGDLYFLRRDGPDTLVDDTDAVFGSFTFATSRPKPSMADIDADGDLDLFVGGYDGKTYFVENDGSNAFVDTPTQTLDGLDMGYWAKPTLCDVDGDSDLDAVLGRNAAKLVLLENLGTPWAPLWSSADAVDIYDGAESFLTPSCMPGVGIAAGSYDGQVLWWPLVAHPTAPAAISATVGYGSATLEWTLPASTGGSTEDLQYVVVANTSLDVEHTTTADLFMSFPGLTPHEPVVFAVRAVNEVGTSRYSDWTTTAVYPFPQPSAPRDLVCYGRDYSIELQWSPSENNDPTHYVITPDGSTTSGTNATVAGLDNDATYTIQVYGVNADGAGEAANCTATPFAPHVLVGEADAAELWGDDHAVVDFGSTSETAVALGDWDGDGDSDMIVYEAAALHLYVRNDSRLVLDESFSYPALSSSNRLVPTMADLDGDGDMDLVVGSNPTSNTLHYLRRDGPDTLVDDTDAVFGSFTFATSRSGPSMADIDADGDLDLFVGGYDGKTYFVENDGSNAFTDEPTVTLDGFDPNTWAKVTLCDVDGDSDLDALVGRNAAELWLLENLGTPWAPVWSSADAVDIYDGAETYLTPSCMPGVGIAVGSYNGDVLWWPLVAHPTAPAAISATVGYGSATLEWTLPASTGNAATEDLQYVVVANTSLGVEHNTTADLFMSFPGLTPHEPVVFAVRAVNGGGTSRYSDWTTTAVYPFPQPSAPRDLVCYGRDYSIELLWSPSENNDPTHYVVVTPDGSTTHATTSATVTGLDNDATYTIQVYGVNADGAGEAVNCTATPFAPHVLVGEADAAELWGDDDLVVDFGSTSDTAVALGDWDGDGDSDMIVFEASALQLYVREDGQLGRDESFSYPALSSTNRLVPTMTDLDGDGDMDLVVGNNAGSLQFLRRDGPDTLVDDSDAVFGSFDVGTARSAPAMADIDADGDLDLFVAAYNGKTYFVENDGSNSFVDKPMQQTLDDFDPGSYAVVTLCDVDGDSDLDALVGRNAAELWLLENLGTPWAPVWSTSKKVDIHDGSETYPTPSCMPGVGIAAGSYNGDVLWWPLVAHPTAPAAISATAGYGSATLEWTLPVSNGGSTADLQYVVVANTSLDVEYNTTADLFMSFPGLTPHEPVVFAVRAVNEIGTSRYSDWTSTAAYPFPQPSAPRDLRCFGRDYSIELQWSPSENNDPTHYVVVTPDGGTTHATTSATVAGLDNDATYTIQVHGVNAYGDGEAAECTATSHAPYTVVLDVEDNDGVIPYSTSWRQIAPTFGDWDADGDLDLLVSTNGAGISLFYGNGSYYFDPEASDAVNVVGSLSNAAAAVYDADADGDLDMVVGHSGSDFLFYRRGSSSLAEDTDDNPFDELAGQMGTFLKPTFGDVDMDGDLDLAVGSSSGSLFVCENIDGHFPLASCTEIFDNGADYIAPALCDLDGDGDLELMFGRYNGGINVWENVGTVFSADWQGSSGLNPFSSYDAGEKSLPACAPGFAVVFGSRYGIYDLAHLVAHPSEPTAVAVAKGFGTYDVSWAAPAEPQSLLPLWYTVVNNVTSANASTTDLFFQFPDLLLDVPVAFGVLAANDAGASRVNWLLTTAATPSADASAPQGLLCVAADGAVTMQWSAPLHNAQPTYSLRVDGALVVANTTATNATVSDLFNYQTYELAVRSGWRGEDAVCSATPAAPRVLAAAAAPSSLDLPSSARPVLALLLPDELLAVGDSDSLTWMQSNGSAWLSTTRTIIGGLPSGSDYFKPTLVDADADGDVDLFLGSDNEMYYYENHGSNYREGSHYLTEHLAANSEPKLAVEDLDADGDLDYMVGVYNGKVYSCADEVDGTKIAVVEDDFGSHAVPELCDFDADGDFDLFVGAASGDVVSIENTGDATAPEFLSASVETVLATGGTYASPACWPNRGLLVGSTAGFQWLDFLAHPEPPLAVWATLVGAGFVDVAWESAYDGGVAVSMYTVAGTVNTTACCAARVPGLASGMAASLTVVSRNALGGSRESPAVTVVLPAVNVSLSLVEAGAVDVSWTADAVALGTVDSAAISWSGGGVLVLNHTAPPVRISGLNCSAVNVTVTLFNASSSASMDGSAWTRPPFGVCPRSCSVDASTAWIDPTQLDAHAAHCYGEVWTVFAAVTTGGNQAPVVSPDAIRGGDPLAFEPFKLDWASTQALNAMSVETLLVRADGSALHVDVPLLPEDVDYLDRNCTVTDVGTGASAEAVVGYTTEPAAYSNRGGDVGIGSVLTHRFASLYNTNAACQNHYLGSYGGANTDAYKASYWSSLELGDWANGASCPDDTGLQLLFAVRMQPLNTTMRRRPERYTTRVWTLESFGLSSNAPGAQIQVRVDGAEEWVALEAAELDGAAEGEHKLEARAILGDGDWWPVEDSPATAVWRYDMTPPAVTLAPRATLFSNDESPTFGLSASESVTVFQHCVDGSLCASTLGDDGIAEPPETTLLSAAQLDGDTVTLTVDSSPVQVSTDYSTWTTMDAVSVAGLADGWHSVQVRAVDSAGSVDESPVVQLVDVGDADPPDTSFATDVPALVAVGDAVEVWPLGGETYEASWDMGATWAEGFEGGALELEAGLHLLAVRAVDAAGNRDPTPAIAAIHVAARPVAWLEVAPPATCPFSMVAFAVRVDVGAAACRIPWALSPTGAAGETELNGTLVLGPLEYGEYSIEFAPECGGLLADPLTLAFEVTSDDSAKSFTVAVDEGPHVVSAYAVDFAGNVGAEYVYNWTVDVTPPETAVAFAQQQSEVLLVNASCVDTSAPCTFELTVDGVSVEHFRNMSDGLHAVSVAAVDQAGNVDPTPVAVEVTIDSTAPEIDVVAVRGWAASAPLFHVSCADLLNECESPQWRAGSVAGEGSVVEPAGLADGAHTLNVSASDSVGNVATLTAEFVVDTGAPTTRFEPLAAVYVADPVLDLNVSCADALTPCTVNVTANGAPWAAGVALGDANYSLEAVAVDLAGNVGAAERQWAVVDTVAPAGSVAGVAYAADGGSVALEMACEDATMCEFWLVESGGLSGDAGWWLSGADGSYNVTMGVRDAAGNVGADVVAAGLVLDTEAPVVGFASQPALYVAAPTNSFVLAVEDANLVGCWCNAWACAPGVTYDVAADGDGPVVLSATCEDVRGHATAANATWTVDTTAPVVALEWAATLTNDPSWSFAFSVDDASPTAVACSVGAAGATSSCESPWAVTAAGDGEYTLQVVAEDAAGNMGSANATFVLDATAPTIDVTLSPALANSNEQVDAAFRCVTPLSDSCPGAEPATDPDCALSYSLDGGARVADEDGELSVLASALGMHNLTLFAVDAAGNEASEVVAWERTDDAVLVTFVRGPPTPNGASLFTFEWEASAAADFVWRLGSDPEWTSAGVVGSALNVSLDAELQGSFTLHVAAEGSEERSASWTWSVSQCSLGFIESLGDDGLLLCDPCPDGVVCVDGEPYFDAGWWWDVGDVGAVTADSVLYKCRVPEMCLGGSECGVGYEGVACDSCAPGYGRTLQLTCKECSSTGSAAVVVVLAIIFVAVLVGVSMFVVKQSLKTDARARAVSTVKIMANYFLMMGILKDMDLDWGSILTKLFSWMKLASGSGTVDVQLVNCVARMDTFDQYRLYFLVPAVLVVAPWLFLWGYAGVRRLRGGTGSARIWGHSKAFVYRQSLLVLAYFAYPTVVTSAFRVLHCTEIDGQWRLVEDYSKVCAGGEYDALYGVAVFFTSVVALGVPLSMFLVMRRRREELTAPGTKAHTQYFFFFGEFKPEWYWWEVTVLTRKVLMGAIAVLLSNHEQNMQVYVGTWLLLFSFTAQIACQPHEDPLQRNLEVAAQGTVLASLLLGQGMAFEDVTDAQLQTFQLCVLVLNVLVMNCMGLILGREAYNEARVVVRERKLTRGMSMQASSSSSSSAAEGAEVEMATRFSMQNPMGESTVNPLGAANPLAGKANPLAAAIAQRPAKGRAKSRAKSESNS